jgi:PD-(D/E)XK nuclease superfamily
MSHIFDRSFTKDSLENSSISGSGTSSTILGSDTELASMVSLEDAELIQTNAVPLRVDPIKAISGSIDTRIKFLSHSSSGTLHACPRKYQLYKLRSAKAIPDEISGITFAYGHVVGEGIQLALQNLPYKQILFKMFVMWHAPLAVRDEKRKKSFAEAVFAVRKFIALRAAGYLEEYELVYLPSTGEHNATVPACELGFAVNVYDGFSYRGFVDAVLRNRYTGEIIVLECKTTWYSAANPAQFKNSGQALGYSVVLDSLFPGLSSYSVLYLVYSTTTHEFTPLPFAKSFESRAEWIRSIVFDVEDITRYEEAGIYPRRGESCFSFNRPCEYLENCGTSTVYLAKPLDESMEQIAKDEARYTYQFNLVDLINRQVARNTEVLESTNG